MDVAKSHIPSWWASAVTSWQHVAEHYHDTKLWPSLNTLKKVNASLLFSHLQLGACNFQNQVPIEVNDN